MWGVICEAGDGTGSPPSRRQTMSPPLTLNHTFKQPCISLSPSASLFLLSVMDCSGQWALSYGIPTDIRIRVGRSVFPLHKFMLVGRSGYMRRMIMDSDQADLGLADLSALPGGAEAFDNAARFCYGVNFEITVHNAAALWCAAAFLEMTDDGNLAGRAEEFLVRAGLKTLPGAVAVLRSCAGLLPAAEELGLLQTCVGAVSFQACNEWNFPSRSPAEWWAGELSPLPPSFFLKVLSAMRGRGGSTRSLTTAATIYAGNPRPHAGPSTSATRLESVVSLLPSDTPVSVLCCLLRAAITLDVPFPTRRKLEDRVSAAVDQASAGDLLTISTDSKGCRVGDLDTVRRIVLAFIEVEAGCGDIPRMKKVARTVDAYVAEIANEGELSVMKFAGMAGALPRSARGADDSLYRAADLYLKAHPELDEIEREKVCGFIDPMKLSYEARMHASQNKRMPLQMVLHALYYDRMKLRSGSSAAGCGDEPLKEPTTATTEAAGRTGAKREEKKGRFFSSVLGKIMVFMHGSSAPAVAEAGKPRGRRFSMG